MQIDQLKEDGLKRQFKVVYAAEEVDAKVSEKLTLSYGDNIPKGAISKERLKKFQDLGYIGDILENIAEHPEVRALKEQIRRRDDKLEALEKSIVKLKAKIEELKEPPEDENSDTGDGKDGDK